MTNSYRLTAGSVIISLAFAAGFYMETADAAVYKWVDANGVTQYSDAPPAGTAAPTAKTVEAPKPTPSTEQASASSAGSATSSSNGGNTLTRAGLRPAVDISKNMTPVSGYSTTRIKNIGYKSPVGDGDGQFRIDCGPSHMGNDDPLVFPNQKGAANHYTFFGNTSVNAKSNVTSMEKVGNSTCRGGTANRSGYWMPSIIDTSANAPLVPSSALWYYKTGYRVDKSKMTTPPKGLRIIAGNMNAKSETEAEYITYTCQMPKGQVSPKSTNYIPACPQGATIVTHVNFPQCWDGKNLDSLDHKSHMAYSRPKHLRDGGCPATHPIAIPKISLNTKYAVTSPSGTKGWRLSSDNYSGGNSGYSGHAIWVNGWDETVISSIVKNCLRGGLDCGNASLGDGRVIY